jgi:hypothetical protein
LDRYAGNGKGRRMTGTTMDGGVVLVVGNYERTRFFFT